MFGIHHCQKWDQFGQVVAVFWKTQVSFQLNFDETVSKMKISVFRRQHVNNGFFNPSIGNILD